MAIQALATVAGYFSDRTLDLTVTIAHDARPSATATFKLTQENAIILQMAEVIHCPVPFHDVQATKLLPSACAKPLTSDIADFQQDLKLNYWVDMRYSF